MKLILEKTGEAMLILLSVLILGMFIPFVISSFIVIFSDYTYQQCVVENVIFWIFTIICWVVSGIYINDVVTKRNDG